MGKLYTLQCVAKNYKPVQSYNQFLCYPAHFSRFSPKSRPVHKIKFQKLLQQPDTINL